MKNQSDNYEKPDISNLSMYDKVSRVSEYLLKAGKVTSSDKAKSGKDLFNDAKKAYENVFEFNTFIQYLSKISKEDISPITCLGRKQGYYFDEEINVSVNGVAPVDLNEDDSVFVKRKQNERLLYPVMKAWLVTEGYRAKDTSTNKSLGKWGNPDLIGINVEDGLHGLASLEIVTIEVKTSNANWEQLIFEAVSHRRFANRAYFAFARSNKTEKIDPKMRYYAELYKIGIIAIEMEEDDYKKLDEGKIKQIDADSVEIKEIYSAPYSAVQTKYQLQMLNSLGILSARDLYSWGDGG